MKIQKILLQIAALLCIAGIVVAGMKGNIFAVSAWLVSTLMTIGWVSALTILENSIEDNRFWKRQFTNAQERYARTIPDLDEPEPAKPDEVNADGKK